jgi:hypothetical protein
MERTLHRQIKAMYGPDAGGRSEVRIEGYRVDAVDSGGELIEVQSGPIGPLLGKLARLLHRGERVRVVKPLILTRMIAWRKGAGKAIVSQRRSPRRGSPIDVFDDLMGASRLLDVSDFTLELLGVEIRELRLPSRRRRGYRVEDRELLKVISRQTLTCSEDLLQLLPVDRLPDSFTTFDLGRLLDRPRHVAQRVAYCLRVSGAVRVVGKRGNSRLYVRRERPAPASRLENHPAEGSVLDQGVEPPAGRGLISGAPGSLRAAGSPGGLSSAR